MKVIDLSLTLKPGMPVFPGTPAVEYHLTHSINKDTFRLGKAVVNSHAGTHADATKHFLEDGIDISEMDLNHFVGPAVMIDCTHLRRNNEIKIEDLMPFESEITPGIIMIIHTGWYENFGEDYYFTDYPYISEKTASWLISKKIKTLALDSASLNPDKPVEIHQMLFKNNIAVIECLTNLYLITQKEFLFVGAPLKLAEADGFPIRAMAIEQRMKKGGDPECSSE